jgi:hypothetical protein
MTCPACGTESFGTTCEKCRAPIAPLQADGTGATERVVGVYEMLWDCAFCGTKALLGRTNRNCPSCGANQDPTKRYFPPPGQEKAANTEYDGVDRVCPACSTPNGAKANHCRQCGSPLDGAAAAPRLSDPLEGAAALPLAPPKKRSWVKWLVLSLVVCVLGFGLMMALWKRQVGATVEGLAWSREIDIETFRPVQESSWCDSMPSDAYATSRSRRQRSTRDVPDGQDCRTKNVDRGDGTFERREVCTTRYRHEPVYDYECSYTVRRWRPTRTERAGGGLADPRRWPPVALSRPGLCLGCERTGQQREQYVLTLQDTSGKHHKCEKPEGQWLQYVAGQRYPVQVRVLTGGIDCDSLKP